MYGDGIARRLTTPEFNAVNEAITQVLQPLVGGNYNNTFLAENQGSNNNTLMYDQPHGSPNAQ
jgi:hypothetical protein